MKVGGWSFALGAIFFLLVGGIYFFVSGDETFFSGDESSIFRYRQSESSRDGLLRAQNDTYFSFSFPNSGLGMFVSPKAFAVEPF